MKKGKKEIKEKVPKDADGKPVEAGCKLSSKLFPDNKVGCESITDKGVWLKQEQAGSMEFFLSIPALKNSKWVVFKYPDKRLGGARRDQDY